MAKVSAKNAVILVDDDAGAPQDISTDVESYDIEYAVDPVEVTGFGDGSKNFIPGQMVVGITLNIYWNNDANAPMDFLPDIIGQVASVTVSITPEIGGPALSGEFMCDGIHPAGAASGGDIKLGAVHFSVMGDTAPAWA